MLRSFRLIFCVLVLGLCLNACGQGDSQQEDKTIPILSWAGMPLELSYRAFHLARECGIDWHLGLYSSLEDALKALDLAAEAGIGLIPGFPEMKDSTEMAVSAIRNHPALVAYHLKDEPEIWDMDWLRELNDKVQSIDSTRPCYINHYPNWAWGEERYVEYIEKYASNIDTQFYSFDQYPVTEVDGEIVIRPTWYRNLEEFSAMARAHGKPFWAFALTLSHHLGHPSPPAFYPVPTMGHLRLQVFSDLLYGAQVIQYFTLGGPVDKATGEKTPLFDLIRQMNSEIKAYSPVFLGCEVMGVWHIGEVIPPYTTRLEAMPHKKLKSLSVNGEGAVVSLIKNRNKTYLAIQNRDCVNEAQVNIDFKGRVRQFTMNGPEKFKEDKFILSPGDMAIFEL